MPDDPIDWNQAKEFALGNANTPPTDGIDWNVAKQYAIQKNTGLGDVIKKDVVQTIAKIGQSAWSGYKGLSNLMDPNVWVEDWRRNKFGAGEDVPGKPGMKFYKDIKEPGTSRFVPDLPSGETPSPKMEVIKSAAKQAVGVPLLTTSRVLGIPDEIPDYVAEKLLGEKPPKNFWTTTLPELAGFAAIAGTISKGLTALSPSLKAAIEAGQVSAPAVREGLSVGIEAARREYARTGDKKAAMDSFLANAPLGATFGVGEGLKIKGEAALPKAPQEMWQVDKNLAQNQQAIAEFRAKQAARSSEVEAYRRFTEEKPTSKVKSVELPPYKPEPIIPEDVYGRTGVSEITGKPFESGSIKLGPQKIEPPISTNPYDMDLRTPKSTTLYSGIPIDEIKNILGDDHPIGRLISGKSLLEDPIRGYDPVNGPLGKVDQFVRKWFGYEESPFPTKYAEAKRTAAEKSRGAFSFAQEELTPIWDLPSNQREVVRKVIRGEVDGTEPDFILEARASGVDQKYINAAKTFRSEANALQDYLVENDLISEESALRQKGTYLKKMYKPYLEPLGVGRRGGVKKIYSRKELDPEWVKENIVDAPELQGSVGLTQDVQRVAQHKLFKTVGSDEFLTLPKEKEANLEMLSDDTAKLGAWEYQKMPGVDPNTLKEGTVARRVAETYGLAGLQGRWILKDVAQDILSTMEMPGAIGKSMKALDLYLRARGWWKVGKAAVNTANSIGNLTYNNFILDMAMPKASPYLPSGFKFLQQAWNDLKTKSPEYLQHKLLGTFGGHYGKGELDRIVQDILQKGDGNSMEVIGKSIDELAQKSAAHYRLSEELYKMAHVRYLKEVEGMSDQAASRLSRKHFFDYGDVPRAVRFLRNVPGGPAFITFQAKAIPRAVEYVARSSNITNPKAMMKFWKYPVALKALDNYSRSVTGFTDEEIKKAKLNNPKWARRFLIQLPFVTEDRQPVFFDPRYVLPFMDLVGTVGETPGLNLLGGSGPEWSIVEALVNKRRYDDRQIVPGGSYAWSNPEASMRSVGKLGEHFFRSLAPQLAVSGMNIVQAARGEKDITGKPYRSLPQEIARAAGIPLIIPKKGTKERNVLRDKADFNDYVRSIRNDINLSSTKKQNLIKKAVADFNSQTKMFLTGE